MTDLNIDPRLDLVLERSVPVPPEKVWLAWTKPEHLRNWWVPKPWVITECEVDLRPGGRFMFNMQSPDGSEKSENDGCFLEVVPNRRIVWTDALVAGYRPSQQPFLTAVITFEPDGNGGTRYRAVAMHRDPEIRGQHEAMGFHEGWGTVADQMIEYVQQL